MCKTPDRCYQMCIGLVGKIEHFWKDCPINIALFISMNDTVLKFDVQYEITNKCTAIKMYRVVFVGTAINNH